MSRTAVQPSRRWRVHLTVESRLRTVAAAKIRRIVTETLRLAERDIAPPSVNELHVLLIDDESMRAINRAHRGKDKATDVLSFPQFSPAEIQGRKRVKGVGSSYLGDLVISTETTVRQANDFEVDVRDEFIRLVVHGVLHLCGYDHEGVPKTEADRMRRRERVIRRRVASALD